MAQFVSNQFQAALSHLLAAEGRGAQSRLAGQQHIDRGYLNGIVKGRKPGSEEVRVKIAAHFGMAYEEMLALGRRLLAGEEEEGDVSSSHVPEALSGENAREEDHRLATLERVGSISEVIRKAVTILESDTRYRGILADLIDVFYEAVGTAEDNLSLRNQMREMELRIAGLEKRLSEEKDHPKKFA